MSLARTGRQGAEEKLAQHECRTRKCGGPAFVFRWMKQSVNQSINQSINQPSDQSINPAIICVHASWFRGRKIPRRCSRSSPDFEQLPHRRLLRRQEAWRGPTDVRVYKTCRVVMPLSQSLCLWPLPHTHTHTALGDFGKYYRKCIWLRLPCQTAGTLCRWWT